MYSVVSTFPFLSLLPLIFDARDIKCSVSVTQCTIWSVCADVICGSRKRPMHYAGIFLRGTVIVVTYLR